MIVKNGRDLPIEQITSENYVVPRGEEMVYHVKIEVKQFNAKTGERISRPRVQKFGIKTWQGSVRDSLVKQGYTIDVLHDPMDWIVENKARVEAEKAAAMKAEKAAEKEAMKAAILEELKAAGIIPSDGKSVEDTTSDGTSEVDKPSEKKVGRPPKKD
jgi:hypothetical protein